MKTNNISKHITYVEAIHNNHGFANVPDEPTLEKMEYVAEKIFEPVRIFINLAILINSFYRCVLLNRHIGGAYKSQHVSGEAIDMSCKGLNHKIFYYILDHLNFDQLIWEGGSDQEPDWVHVSCKKSDNRNQALRMVHVNGIQKYIPYV